MKDHSCFVYIVANATRQLYTGVTDGVRKRVWQHKNKVFDDGFTTKWSSCRLVYFEEFDDINFAIAREKQLKRWRREKKFWLIESTNPNWHDLSDGWYDEKTKALPLDSGLKSLARGDTRRVMKGRGPIAEKRERNWQKKIERLKQKATK